MTRRLVAVDYLKDCGSSSGCKHSDAEAIYLPRNPSVPFRNAHLLSIAASWAETIDARRIYIGAVAEDSSGYPDCRPEFYEAFQRAIEVGTRPETQIEIVTPVIHLRKAEIIRRGSELGAPLELTWSCYRSAEQACGCCDSCALRLRAFAEAGLQDPIDYA